MAGMLTTALGDAQILIIQTLGQTKDINPILEVCNHIGSLKGQTTITTSQNKCVYTRTTI